MKSDADSTLSYEDIISQILTYLNLHIIQVGYDYYIFDWNTLKSGSQIKWTDILTNTNLTYTPKLITLTGDMHVDDNTNITVDEVYNTIKVRDSVMSQSDAITSPLSSDSLFSPFKMKYHYMTEFLGYGSHDGAHHAIKDRKSVV